MTEIARTSQRPMSFSVQQDFEAPERWRDLMVLAESLQREGLDVKAQVAPRPIGVLLGLQASSNVFAPVRAYAQIAGLPLAERVEALRSTPSSVASTRCSCSMNPSTTTSIPLSR